MNYPNGIKKIKHDVNTEKELKHINHQNRGMTLESEINQIIPQEIKQ